MITYKFKIQNKIDITNYIRQYNNVLRFSYNRFKDNKDLSVNDIIKLVKNTMNNIELLDASLIQYAVDQSKSLKKKDKVIFGGTLNFFKLKNKKIEKEEFDKNMPMLLRGSCTATRGNRKAQLDVIENNSVILKLNKITHFNIQLPKLNKHRKELLHKLQLSCEENKAYFSIQINNEYIWILFEELNMQKIERNVIQDRILSFDMNPNYIGLSIIDWKDQENKSIIHKEIIDLSKINSLKHDKYQTNKRKYETFNISKYIIDLVKHYNVDIVSFEKLNINSSNKGKGTHFNKLCNNYWLRNALVGNIKKRCNLLGITYQEILPQYSSFIGQINNPTEIDSIASSMELSRRTYLFKKIYKEKMLQGQNIMFPAFNIGSLTTHWKEMLKDNLNNIKSWKELYDWFKKSKTSYRFLFSKETFFGNSLRLFSVNSNVLLHSFT